MDESNSKKIFNSIYTRSIGKGYDQFPLGILFNRNISINMGQCPVKKYSEQLFHLIETKKIESDQNNKPYNESC